VGQNSSGANTPPKFYKVVLSVLLPKPWDKKTVKKQHLLPKWRLTGQTLLPRAKWMLVPSIYSDRHVIGQSKYSSQLEPYMQSILAVDDSPSMRKMVSFTLTGAGYHVVEAVDGQDALEKAESHDIHLVLADQNMPRLDGIGLTRKLREHPKFKTIPILILTTESSDQMKQAGRSAGATGWLVKPFDPNRLIEVIQKVIR